MLLNTNFLAALLNRTTAKGRIIKKHAQVKMIDDKFVACEANLSENSNTKSPPNKNIKQNNKIKYTTYKYVSFALINI
jgi:hypothetical protein